MRKKPPARRRSETFSFIVQGQFGRGTHEYYANVGFYPNGKVCEIFLRPKSGKSGTELNIATLEMSVAISMALQAGVTVEEMRAAFPRNENQPEGALGTLLDLITETGIKDALAEVLE
jgi:hypothetical protein